MDALEAGGKPSKPETATKPELGELQRAWFRSR